MSTTVRFLGTTDDVTTCECCGRQDLKSTVALDLDGDSGQPTYYGVVCAARALKMDAKSVKSAARKADEDKARAERARTEALARAKDAAWQAHLDARAPGLDRFSQIQALGGIVAARYGFAWEAR
jgi:hypothetical protein